MTELLRTVYYDTHVGLGAKMVAFGGWEMPVQYRDGIIKEHLATRREAGLFDVSHMGRFEIAGSDALPFLQYVLTNNAAALEAGESQYTMIPDSDGGAIDDAYLYRFFEDRYLLVVNAANRLKDWDHFQQAAGAYPDLSLTDRTMEMAMVSLQGPISKQILTDLLDEESSLPDPLRNELAVAAVGGHDVLIGRTGYTGEPLCFELFCDNNIAVDLWQQMVNKGATPVGLGARDTLRLEAALPLYGHELGEDADGRTIPIYACPLAAFAVSLSPLKGDFIGRAPLTRQFEAWRRIADRDFSRIEDLPRRVQPVMIQDKGVARSGCAVYREERMIGRVTSGTMVPYWRFAGEGIDSKITMDTGMRAIALALMDSDVQEGNAVEVDVRGRRLKAMVVPYHLRSEAPPYARPITCYPPEPGPTTGDSGGELLGKVTRLIDKTMDYHQWRQHACINLIPSEQTASGMTRLLSIADPMGRYAEHKPVKAFCDTEVFYYQGTDFIAEVESLLRQELAAYLGCHAVETRPISGQMANMAVFSAMVDYINRADRKSEQRRIRKIFNHHIIRGGHLSAQPLGALRDYVARDPQTEKPAVVNFPVLADDPYAIDLDACRTLMAEHSPELIILGKSMILYREPVGAIRDIIDDLGIDCTLMYDMAHVLGLVGPHYQEPFSEGADVVTGSTHKTFFGSQRGIVAANWKETDPEWYFWEAIGRRSFPGSTSNHHPGTLLALLLATYEMNAFKDEYQAAVIRNAKGFAAALNDTGLSVAGNPEIGFTETHQVVVEVGYARGPEIARRLEDNNIIVNYQATPAEEGFTASGGLRMGVSEMTRFGMDVSGFQELAQLMHDAIVSGADVREAVIRLRSRYRDLQYCFSAPAYAPLMEKLHGLI